MSTWVKAAGAASGAKGWVKTGGKWVPMEVPAGLKGLGGWADVTAVTGNPTKHAYTANGEDWVAYEFKANGSVTTTKGLADALVVGGGGGGGGGGNDQGRNVGGGGGAGDVIRSLAQASDGTHAIIVGSGGSGGASGGPGGNRGGTGSGSKVFDITAAGGGGGYSFGGGDGACGGGCYAQQPGISISARFDGQSGVKDPGNNADRFCAGGGGGVGGTPAAPTNGFNGPGGNGGPGVSDDITGVAKQYGGGGGGGGAFGAPSSGTHGGGNGGGGATTPTAGSPNTGGGGGGCSDHGMSGAAGGSGVVIIRVPKSHAKA